MPRLLMNRDMVGPLAWRPRSRDVVQLGDLVHSVERLVELLGWTEEMKDLVRRETGKVQTTEQGPRGAALFTAPWPGHGWHQLPGLCRHPAPTQMEAVTLSMLTSGRAGMRPGSLRPPPLQWPFPQSGVAPTAQAEVEAGRHSSRGCSAVPAWPGAHMSRA